MMRATATIDVTVSAIGNAKSLRGGTLLLSSLKYRALRYGENPHQAAAWYRTANQGRFEVLQGKALSFTNLLDLDAALRIASDYTAPTVVITKHTDPVGLGSSPDLRDAYRKALETDPVAAFGSIVAVNRPVDAALAGSVVRVIQCLCQQHLAEFMHSRLPRRIQSRDAQQQITRVRDAGVAKQTLEIALRQRA